MVVSCKAQDIPEHTEAGQMSILTHAKLSKNMRLQWNV